MSEAVFLPYQQRWIADQSDVRIIEKSRRVGITWAEAGASSLEAAEGRYDVYYIGYNEDQALEFIRDAADWAKRLNLVASKMGQCLVSDEKKDILSYRISFASGKRITALSSRPRNLRGKQGKIIIDEAAFHDDLQGLIKASFAMLIWGGKVSIISTHNGVDNEFNRLIEETRAGLNDYSLHRVTLDDALNEGLYDRICEIKGETNSPAKQEKWRNSLLDQYGAHADEELLCLPKSYGDGSMFDRSWFRIVSDVPSGIRSRVRYWDLAATDPKPGTDPDFTAGLLMAKTRSDYYVLDLVKDRVSPKGVENLLRRTSELDGVNTAIGYEEEPGSSGKMLTEHLRESIFRGRRFYPVRSTGSKASRAKPASAASEEGRIILLDRPWTKDLLSSLQSFPYGRHDDDVDAFSGAYNMLEKGLTLERYMRNIQNF